MGRAHNLPDSVLLLCGEWERRIAAGKDAEKKLAALRADWAEGGLERLAIVLMAQGVDSDAIDEAMEVARGAG